MPKYRKKDGTIVSFTKPVPSITQKMLGLRPARPVITVKDIEDAGKKRKQAGGTIKKSKPKKKVVATSPKSKPPEMSRGVQARERARANLQSDLNDERQRLRKKFTGRGTAGSEQFRKEMSELTSKMYKKFDIDQDLARKYGKDAYKSRAFGVSPIADKNKSRKMRGGGIAKSGSASLSGYKVR